MSVKSRVSTTPNSVVRIRRSNTNLVVTSVLTSDDVSLTSGSRSPHETDGAAASVTHSICDVNLEITDGKGNAT
jgi:hypothetical protein